jgi:hypothetical protein
VGTQFYVENPHAWRFSAIFSGLIPTMLYLYVRSVLHQEFRLRPHDSLFFIPALLLFINFLPFYMLSVEEKRVIILRMLNNKNLAIIEIDGIFPAGVGVIIRSTTGLLFTFLSISVTYKHKKKADFQKESVMTQNQEVYKWIKFLLTSVLFSYLLLILWNFLGISSKIEFFVAIGLTTAGLIFTICGYLFLKPNILYGLQGWFNSPEVLSDAHKANYSISNSKTQDTETTSFSAEMRIEMRLAIENHFKNNKPFIASGYKIKNLSLELNIPIYLISLFINLGVGLWKLETDTIL